MLKNTASWFLDFYDTDISTLKDDFKNYYIKNLLRSFIDEKETTKLEQLI